MLQFGFTFAILLCRTGTGQSASTFVSSLKQVALGFPSRSISFRWRHSYCTTVRSHCPDTQKSCLLRFCIRLRWLTFMAQLPTDCQNVGLDVAAVYNYHLKINSCNLIDLREFLAKEPIFKGRRNLSLFLSCSFPSSFLSLSLHMPYLPVSGLLSFVSLPLSPFPVSLH